MCDVYVLGLGAVVPCCSNQLVSTASGSIPIYMLCASHSFTQAIRAFYERTAPLAEKELTPARTQPEKRMVRIWRFFGEFIDGGGVVPGFGGDGGLGGGGGLWGFGSGCVRMYVFMHGAVSHSSDCGGHLTRHHTNIHNDRNAAPIGGGGSSSSSSASAALAMASSGSAAIHSDGPLGEPKQEEQKGDEDYMEPDVESVTGMVG